MGAYLINLGVCQSKLYKFRMYYMLSRVHIFECLTDNYSNLPFNPSLLFRSERECIFVFIGKNLDHDWLKQCFQACLVTNELRFKVGDKVQANIGEFTNGKIKVTWDDGNAYRIELEDDNKTNVYAPIDVDTYVRVGWR